MFNIVFRYLINKKSFKPGGPLFFYTGNEGFIETFVDNTGIIFDLAPNFNALIVFCEHRFYGNGSSLPYGTHSFDVNPFVSYIHNVYNFIFRMSILLNI
jgi:hypothetical protein